MADNSSRRDENLRTLDKELKSRERSEKLRPLGVMISTVVVLVLLVGGMWFLITREGEAPSNEASSEATETAADSAEKENPTPSTLPTAVAQPYAKTVTCEYPTGEKASKEVSLPKTENVATTGTVSVTLNTTEGTIPLNLDPSLSPCTVNSIAHLAQEGFYNDVVCHRLVLSESMKILQCGDPTATGTGGPGYTFKDEFPMNSLAPEDKEDNDLYTYKRGSVAMANVGLDTNGSQFFLVFGDTTLPAKYNLFGSISEDGLKTLDKVDKDNESLRKPNEMGESFYEGKPTNEVKITSATVK